MFDKQFVSTYKQQILNQIIKNQDDLFISAGYSVVDKIVELVGENSDFYTSLSDENLIRMFSFDSKNTSILNEIINRVNNGSHIFSRKMIV